MVTPTPAGRTGFAISLKGRALRLLAGREHSRVELERKLAVHAPTPEELVQVLDELQAKDFISEARVVASVINRRQARLGASRIKRELQGKGIDADMVANAMGELKATELERAREVWRKKFDSKTDAPPLADISPAERAKQMRFLAARGFGAEVIRRVVAGRDGEN